MSGGGGGSAPTVYNVPWKIFKVAEAPKQGLVLYWFPASNDEVKRSSLRESRTLSLYASQCVAMELADPQIPHADKLIGDSKLPVAVLASPDGTPVSKIENTNGKLKVVDVEKLLDTEMRQRESALERFFCELALMPYGASVPVVDGGVEVPDAPGLGADPEAELIERFRA